MSITKGNFVEVSYTGMLEDGTVFDTTDEKIAKDSGVFQSGAGYGNIVVCIGQGHILKGLEEQLEGKEAGKEYRFTIAPENAFGKKDAKLLRLISTGKFTKEKIMPQPGLEVSVDGMMGIIKTVTGGRVIVDFNHPLSGKTVIYTINPIRIVTDSKEEVSSIIKIRTGMADSIVSISGSECKITEKKMPKEVEEILSEEIKRTTQIKSVSFEEAKEEKKEENKKEPEEKAHSQKNNHNEQQQSN